MLLNMIINRSILHILPKFFLQTSDPLKNGVLYATLWPSLLSGTAPWSQSRSVHSGLPTYRQEFDRSINVPTSERLWRDKNTKPFFMWEKPGGAKFVANSS
jgi:hypothetical protein